MTGFRHARLTAIVLFTLIATASATAQEHQSSVLAPDLAEVPPDVNFLVAINLTKYWDSPESESLNGLANTHPVIPTWSLRDLPGYTGIKPENMVRLLMFNTGGGGVTVVRTKQPYDRIKVIAAITPEPVQKTAGGKTFVHSDKTGNDAYLLDERTLVLGLADMAQDLTGHLSRPSRNNRDPSLERVLLESQAGAPFIVHAGPKMIQQMAAEKDMRYGPFAPLASAHDWQIIASIDKILTIELKADFHTHDDAEKATAAYAVVAAKLSEVIPLYRAHMGPFLEQEAARYPNAKNIIPEMNRTLENAAVGLREVNIHAEGTTAIATIEIKTDKPATAAVMVVTLTPRGAKRSTQNP